MRTLELDELLLRVVRVAVGDVISRDVGRVPDVGNKEDILDSGYKLLLLFECKLSKPWRES